MPMRCLVFLQMMIMIGCATDPIWISRPQQINADAYADVYRASQQVLKDFGFQLDRKDYRFGVISTKPLRSPSLIEPWKHANATFSHTEQSAWSELRRIVRVTIEPSDRNDELLEYDVDIRVDLERLSLPLRRLDGTARRRNIFTSLSSIPEEWRQRGIIARYWESIGRDNKLEQKLLGQIMKRAGQELEDKPVTPMEQSAREKT